MNLMQEKELYLQPACEVVEMHSSGMLCSSGEGVDWEGNYDE